jgi:hypothetical protein
MQLPSSLSTKFNIVLGWVEVRATRRSKPDDGQRLVFVSTHMGARGSSQLPEFLAYLFIHS